MNPEEPGLTIKLTPVVEGLLDFANLRPNILKAILTVVFGCLFLLDPAIARSVVGVLVVMILPGALDLRCRLRKTYARLHEVETRTVEAEKEKGWACAALRIAMARVEELEAELVAARRRLGGGTSDPVYRSVGLDADAPDYIVAAARRAHRVALHPDKQPPEGRRAAHDRYVAVEAAFDAIARRRGT